MTGGIEAAPGRPMAHHLVFGGCRHYWQLQDGRVAHLLAMRGEEARSLGLRQVAFVALVDDATSTYFAQLVPHGVDIDLWEFISRAWQRCGFVPFSLKVKADAGPRLNWLTTACASSGVQLIWVQGDKSHAAKGRHAERHLFRSYWHGEGRPAAENVNDRHQPKTMSSMRDGAQWTTHYDKPLFGEAGSQMVQPMGAIKPHAGGRFATNEGDLAKQESIPSGRVAAAVDLLEEKGNLSPAELEWYRERLKLAIQESGADIASEHLRENSGQRDLRETIAGMLACWPESESVVASRAGITKPTLRLYLSGRQALPADKLGKLRQQLGIEVEDGGLSRLDGSTLYSPRGAYVLYAEGTVHKVADAYRALALEWLVTFAAEVVPTDGNIDARRRLVLLLGQEVDALFVVPRGTRHEALIARKRFESIGEQPKAIPSDTYRLLLRVADLRSHGHQRLRTEFERVARSLNPRLLAQL